ncbi:hypothetical protein H0E87_018562 [Populus deltoides]|uniref:PAS domain-containing protein n=1 Tax=Populus deltoides TaxID=3696 RepID=A0A8T2XT68_POPDE|nr:hypothetical protein H0E87_018562 [Populus deltoides]
MESQLGLIEKAFNTRYSPWVREALEELPHNFTITDPTISGHPIVFASPGFLKMSGFRRDQVIGNNGRMFQGPKTNRKTVMEIREAIREERAVQVSLWNYRKDGTPFWMLFQMSPVFSKDDGRVIHFIGVQERGVETEEPWEASDLEKQRAATAINNILSVLTHYSESTGRLACGKRCSSPAAGLINSSLNISLGRINQSFVLIDPHLPNMPIVYASDAFLKLTGYDRHEVLGCNWRFLSGVGTDSSVLNQIQESIQVEQACTVCFLNYRKDKSMFWNLLHMSPVRNATGKIAYFVGVQMEEKCKSQDRHGLSPETRQLCAVGAVKVAVRSLSMGASCSKSSDRFNTL